MLTSSEVFLGDVRILSFLFARLGWVVVWLLEVWHVCWNREMEAFVWRMG